jgi:hypothetical protein
MDPNSNPKRKLVTPWAIAILVGVIIVAKPWLVEHLGINQISVPDRLVWMVVAAIICVVGIVMVKILNKPKSDA